MKLPDGSTTRSKAVWSAGWRVVGESVERALGWTLLDYDPDFVFDTPSGSVKVDVAIALAIHRLNQEMAVLKACLSYATSNPLPVYDPLPREGLTPEAFVESCKRGRPTKHLHGWLARDLGKMVETILLEREEAHALIQELGHKCDASTANVAMLREALKAYYHECQCQRRDMDKVNMQAYATLRATDGPEDKP